MDLVMGSVGAAVFLLGFIALILMRVRFILHLKPKHWIWPVAVMAIGAGLVATAWFFSSQGR